MLATLQTAFKQIPVLSAIVVWPVTGAWHASLELDTDDAADLEGAAQLVLETEIKSVSLSGVLVLGSVFAGRGSVKLLAGAGGLPKLLPAKSFKDVDLSAIVSATLTEAGEQLDLTSQITGFVPHFIRAATTTSKTLWTLAELFSFDWHVTDAGKLFFGERPSAEYAGTLEILDSGPQYKKIAIEAADVRPGDVIEGATVDRVELCLSNQEVSCWVRCNQ